MMAVDLGRVASKALEAAIEDTAPRRRGSSTVRAMAAGAALAVGARVAMSGKAPFLLRHMPGISELRDIPDRVRDRLADAGWLDDEPDVDEAPEGEELDDDEPEARGEEDFDDEEDEEPEDIEEEDEDEDLEDDEPQAQADEADDEEDEDEEPEDEPPPELEVESEDDEDLHPEDRPPEPPRSKTGGRR